MKNALKRKRSAVKDRVKLRRKFSLPVICNTAKLKAVSVAGYDAFTIGLSRLSSSRLDTVFSPLILLGGWLDSYVDRGNLAGFGLSQLIRVD
jgi:hypothetical protein